MSFSVVCPKQVRSQARSQEARVLQRLPDGSVAVEIDGQKMLAITDSQRKDWLKLQGRFDDCQKDGRELTGQVASLKHQVELKTKDVTIAEQQGASFKADFDRAKEDTGRARQDAQRNFGLFMGERQLRVEARQFIPHGNGGNSIFAKLLNFLDKPVVQTGFKLGIPLYQTFKCS